MRYMRVEGTASIDGPEKLNRRLARERAESVCRFILENSKVNADDIEIISSGENWNDFIRLVETDPGVPMKQEVERIIHASVSNSEKEAQLRALGNGKVWNYLKTHIFPPTRKTVITVGWVNAKPMIEVISDGEVVEIPESVPEPAEEPVPVEEIVEEEIITETVEDDNAKEAAVEVPAASVLSGEDVFRKKLYIKTNMPAWLMLWTNIAVEIDLSRHFSAQIPFYYSGFNYFRRDVKFRTFTIQPEVRWWPRGDNMGFFANIHASMAYYNYAKGGDYRYQDHNRSTPALGGGVGIGYRFHFTQSRRWTMEASVGAGIYRLDYDVFNNVPNGLIIDRRKRTFYGIDHAALSISYSFGIGKKGGGE